MKVLAPFADVLVAALGSGLAAIAGAMAGQASQPILKLAPGERPMAPAVGSPLTPDGGYAGLHAYNGPVPDYVIGTDWLRPTVVEAPADLPTDGAPTIDTAQPAGPPRYTSLAWEAIEPPPAPAYPSKTGDILAGAAEASDASATVKAVDPPPAPPPA